MPSKSRALRRSGPEEAAGTLWRPKNRLNARRNPSTTPSFRPNLNNRPPRPYRPTARLGGKGGKMAYREGGAASPQPENHLS
ncbi:hypothetical protein NDU88_002437 [Pleurodeles waltl]|uniref:Uncharacterized protein n=1 Tax=Pleurodeles waltl TaxID=8319 RepID=A0AAV7NIL8_PLEWA|nr:hypothetical protein NDU88_002437 [Pleurodeles waltl]